MPLSHLTSPGKPLHQVSVCSAANSERENPSVVVVRFHLWWFGCGLFVIVAVSFLLWLWF